MGNVTQNTPNMPTIQFDGTDIRIHDANGDRWVTMRDLSSALGYEREDKIGQIIDRNTSEFHGKVMVLNLRTIKGMRDQRVINYRGIIRVAMKSDAPKAIAFRDWAETVLFDVMTKGHYIVPGAEHAAIMDNPAMKAILEKLSNIDTKTDFLSTEFSHLRKDMDAVKDKQAKTLIPGIPQIEDWLTPTQRLRQIVNPTDFPKWFNAGSGFDLFFAAFHQEKTGQFPFWRKRKKAHKNGEYVVEPCVETDDLLRAAYPKYVEMIRQRRSGQMTLFPCA